MSPLFKRRSTQASVEPDDAPWAIRPEGHEPTEGPFDAADVAERGKRLDMGALWLPVRAGMTVRMDVQRASGAPVAASVSRDGSKLQLQVFAAPKSAGLWDEVRAEISEAAQTSGGKVTEQEGPFGPELLAVMPLERPDGKKGQAKVRFWGVDGPRWFLRGQLTGKATTDAAAAQVFIDIFREAVVVRGTQARPPRELIPLTAPGTKAEPTDADADDGPPGLVPRGPEIAEVR